jgi:hypothetical protein
MAAVRTAYDRDEFDRHAPSPSLALQASDLEQMEQMEQNEAEAAAYEWLA